MWNVLCRIPVATDMANVFFNRKKVTIMLNQTGEVNIIYFRNNKYNNPEEKVM